METIEVTEFISENNRVIESYLGFYLDQQSPGYAVLLTGPWGCGKTWFVDELLAKLNPTEKYVKFSVAGCDSQDDLNSRYILSKLKKI